MIRPYTSNDKNLVIKLLQLNIPKYFAASEKADFITYIQEELEDYFVFEQEGHLIGAAGINYFPSQGIARLSWDFIHPNQHGQGIGSQLVKHRIKHISSQKLFPTIQVRTSQFAYLFYQKMGFKLQMIKKDYWDIGFDLYDMTMAL